MPRLTATQLVLGEMSRVVKILKIAGTVVTSIVVILIAAAFFLQERVADIVLQKLNDKLITKYEYSSLNFSLLRKFPKASLELKNVIVLSSPGFDKTMFTEADTDTLLRANTVLLEFEVTDIIDGEYNIGNIEVRNGTVTLLTDTLGKVNYEFTEKTGESADRPFILDLNKIVLTNVGALYWNRATEITVAGDVERGTLKTTISGDKIDFTAAGKTTITLLRVSYLNISSPFAADLNIDLSSTAEGVRFGKSSVKINKNRVAVSGLVGKDDYIDLAVSGTDINISGIKDYLPAGVSEKLAGYAPAGTLAIDGTIRGKASRTSLPHLNCDFRLEEGVISRTASNMSLTGLTVIGSYSNGNRAAPATSSLKIEDIKGSINNYIFRGSVNLINFDTPLVSVVVDGQGEAADLATFFNLKEITSTSGRLALNMKAKGIYERGREYRLPDIMKFDPTLAVKADSFNINLKNNWFVLDNVSGMLTIDRNIVADNLGFTFREQNISIDGQFLNLASWLMGENVTVTSSAGLKADKLYPERFFNNSGNPVSEADGENKDDKENREIRSDRKNRANEADGAEEKSGANSGSIGKKSAKSLKFPDDMVFDATFEIGEFGYREIYAENMVGAVSYKPTLFNIKNLDTDILGGRASANGFLIKNSDLSLMARGTFDLENVDIHDCLNVFNNFGQEYIKSENIEGNLSGQLSGLVSMDSLFTPNMKTLMVEGDYVINNGALLNFEPIEALSNFIELSELQNIRFESLQNELIIRSNYIYIPLMDIKSSAANLSVSGKHSFDNDYEYHVKILLSEILSNKFKRNRRNAPEFGAVQDDGLGRTSILLVIDPKGARYDMKAVGDRIRQDIKEEKENLRTILNEEYGWFENRSEKKGDVGERNATTEDSRFKIEWEENSDQTETETTTVDDGDTATPTAPRFKILWDDSITEGESEVVVEEEEKEKRSLRDIFRKN